MGVVDCDVSTNGSGDPNGGTVLLVFVVLPCFLRAMLTIRRMTTMAIARALMKLAPSIALSPLLAYQRLASGYGSLVCVDAGAYAIVPVHRRK